MEKKFYYREKTFGDFCFYPTNTVVVRQPILGLKNADCVMMIGDQDVFMTCRLGRLRVPTFC